MFAPGSHACRPHACRPCHTEFLTFVLVEPQLISQHVSVELAAPRSVLGLPGGRAASQRLLTGSGADQAHGNTRRRDSPNFRFDFGLLDDVAHCDDRIDLISLISPRMAVNADVYHEVLHPRRMLLVTSDYCAFVLEGCSCRALQISKTESLAQCRPPLKGARAKACAAPAPAPLCNATLTASREHMPSKAQTFSGCPTVVAKNISGEIILKMAHPFFVVTSQSPCPFRSSPFRPRSISHQP